MVEQQLSRSQAIRAEIDEQLRSQREPRRPPAWIRRYAVEHPPPDGVTVGRAWSMRYRAADRSPELDAWWMCAWIGGQQYLRVPSGLLRGRPWVLYAWQRDFLENAYRPNCLNATLTTGRKNGKSGLLASIVAYHLSRHGVRQGWRGIGVSIGGPQATQFFEDVFELMQVSGMLEELDEESGKPRLRAMRTIPGKFRVDSAAAEFRLMTSNPTTSGVGASVDLALLDELGSYPESSRNLVRNVETSTSARSGRSIAITVEGIQNGFCDARYADWKADPDRHHYARHTAAKDCALDDPEAWRAANPGLGQIKSLEYMRLESAKALRDPAIQGSFRHLELNQRTSELSDLVVSVDDWMRCEVDTAEDLPPRDGPLLLGVDLGGARSFSAACACWPATMRVEGLLAIGAIPDLMDRGRSDGVDDRYLKFEAEGSLVVCPGSELVEHDWLLELLEDKYGVPELAVADEYRRAEFLAAMRAGGHYWPYLLRRMGAGPSGSEDVRAFQRAVVRQEVRIVRSLAWVSAITETKMRLHPTTRLPSIGPRRSTARIDLLAAGTLALGAAERWRIEEAERAKDTGPTTEVMPW